MKPLIKLAGLILPGSPQNSFKFSEILQWGWTNGSMELLWKTAPKVMTCNIWWASGKNKSTVEASRNLKKQWKDLESLRSISKQGENIWLLTRRSFRMKIDTEISLRRQSSVMKLLVRPSMNFFSFCWDLNRFEHFIMLYEQGPTLSKLIFCCGREWNRIFFSNMALRGISQNITIFQWKETIKFYSLNINPTFSSKKKSNHASTNAQKPKKEQLLKSCISRRQLLTYFQLLFLVLF